MGKVQHQHNYDLEFIGDGFRYKLVCRCGDVAPNMETAIERMWLPVWLTSEDDEGEKDA